MYFILQKQLSYVEIQGESQQISAVELSNESTPAQTPSPIPSPILPVHTPTPIPSPTLPVHTPTLSSFDFAIPSTSSCAISDQQQEQMMPHRKKQKNMTPDASPLYQAAIERLSRAKIEKDRFDAYCQGWAMDLREINKITPNGALHVKRLFDEIIFKAYQNQISENTQVMNVSFNNEWNSTN